MNLQRPCFVRFHPILTVPPGHVSPKSHRARVGRTRDVLIRGAVSNICQSNTVARVGWPIGIKRAMTPGGLLAARQFEPRCQSIISAARSHLRHIGGDLRVTCRECLHQSAHQVSLFGSPLTLQQDILVAVRQFKYQCSLGLRPICRRSSQSTGSAFKT